MNISEFLFVMIALLMVSPLRADSQDASVAEDAKKSNHLEKDEKLERMQTNRDLDDKHTFQAQKDLDRGIAEMSGHNQQEVKDVQRLKSVESQVTAGEKQKTLDHQSYKEAVRKYGSEDPRSASARQSMKESKQAMDPLLESRRTLKENVHEGGRLVHNDKTVLGVEKRDMDSDARYRAQDDRSIVKKEKDIADDRKEMNEHGKILEANISSTVP